MPTFRSGLEILTVEASVRDAAGRPLTDLEASDFVVSIDGQPRRVLTARMFGTDDGPGREGGDARAALRARL